MWIEYLAWLSYWDLCEWVEFLPPQWIGVANLHTYGPGSFRWALEAESVRPKVIHFTRGGVIELDSSIEVKNISIIGHTQPHIDGSFKWGQDENELRSIEGAIAKGEHSGITFEDCRFMEDVQ